MYRPETFFISRQVGASVKTDNPFDVAIQGDGWMAIQTQSGIAYTRDGRMRMSESGALETLIGNPVLDAGGGRSFSTRWARRRTSAETE